MKHFDLSQFRKVQSTRSHTIMAHPDGHMIHLSHNNLDEKQLHDLHKLPFEDMKKMAKGGAVKAPGTKANQDKISQGFKGALGLAEGGDVPAQGVKEVAPFPTDDAIVPQAGIMGASQGKPVMQGENPPLAGIDAPAEDLNQAYTPKMPAQQPTSADALGTKQSLDMQKQALEDQITGINKEAKAEGELGTAQATAQKEGQDKLPALEQAFATKMKSNEDNVNHFEQEVLKGKINPNQYLQQHDGILSNVLTGIGLILGGAGAPSTGGRNLASDFLDKQIDNDIKAQQRRLDDKSTLLSYYQKKGHDIQGSFDMAKATVMSGVAAQLAIAAGKSADPLAKARAMQKVAELNQKRAELIRDATARDAVLGGMKGGNVPLEQAVSVLAKTPADKAAADKEVDYIRSSESGIKSINDSFNAVKDIGIIGANNPLADSSATFDAAVATLDQHVRQIMKGQGSLSDQDMKKAEQWYPASKDTQSQLQIKMDSLVAFLKSKAAGHTSTLKRLGIPVNLNFQTQPLVRRD